MIYLLRKHDIISVSSYAKRISSLEERYHIEDISSVPKERISLKKVTFVGRQKVFLFCHKRVKRGLNKGKNEQKVSNSTYIKQSFVFLFKKFRL